VVACPCPFFLDRLLVVVKDADWSSEVFLPIDHFHISEQMKVLWMPEGRLSEIALPNPWAVETFSFPFWLRGAGSLLYGNDIRDSIPLWHCRKDFLAHHLAIYTCQQRSRLGFDVLAAVDPRRPLARLALQRALLMVTALLTQGVWRVFPETIRDEFMRVFRDQRFSELWSDFDYQRCRLHSHPEERRGILDSFLWLQDKFVRYLWELA
jgi:hypothetical protein